MDDFQHIDAIEAYLEQRMSLSERTAFEQKLASDPALKAEFDTYRAAMKLLELKVVEAPPTVKNKRLGLSWWSIAAGVLILIAVGIWAFAQSNYSDKTLVAANYQNPIFSNTLRGETGPGQYQVALADFNQGQYRQAIERLSGIEDEEALFLSAHSWFQLKEWEQAASIFKQLADNKINIRQESAEWFLALSYLAQGKEDKATQILQAIVTTEGHANQQKAQQLNAQLKQFWRKIAF